MPEMAQYFTVFHFAARHHGDGQVHTGLLSLSVSLSAIEVAFKSKDVFQHRKCTNE